MLGQTSTVPDPSCPGLPCQAVGSVTGFQVSNDQTRSPFLVPRDGTIKSWTLTLAQPTNKQRSFFNGFFGTPPEARLAILRRVPGTNPPRYNLRSQGAIKVLTPYLGQTVKFGSSLKVEKGDIVGITVPTWAPAFSQELPANNVWRASREPGTCTNSTDIRQGEPQREGRQPRHLRLQVLDGAPALHGDSRRGLGQDPARRALLGESPAGAARSVTRAPAAAAAAGVPLASRRSAEACPARPPRLHLARRRVLPSPRHSRSGAERESENGPVWPARRTPSSWRTPCA